MDKARITEVVEATLAKDLGTSLEPHSLTKLDAIASKQLREDAAKRTKHGPTGVDHFELTVLGEGLRVS
jgi:hypothetical protein